MRLTNVCMLSIAAGLLPAGATETPWVRWPPETYLVESLVKAVPGYLDAYDEDTGKFGTTPWICQDQHAIYPLAVAWHMDHPENPYYQDEALLAVIARGGEVLTKEMDENGQWVFRKKDNSTWGSIHMPWTYSRWIRAYVLVRGALPEASREKWEEGLLGGFTGIRTYMDDDVHNIPAHHAMSLYIAGACFDRPDWQQAAAAFLHRVVAEQDETGFWSEHEGPVVGYNRVYVDALGVYYHESQDPAVLDALRRAARFHAAVLWPDGSSISVIDERQLYHKRVDTGNVGFSWTPEGRGFLLQQVWNFSNGGEKPVSADYAATMLLYGGEGEGKAPAAQQAESLTALGDGDALIRREEPWQWVFSAYTAEPSPSRWIQDRQNFIEVYRDDVGVFMGGGNTKLQPLWSTFTVGDTAALSHTPGDESPDFMPGSGLQWTPDTASVSHEDGVSRLTLDYGGISCSVTARTEGDALVLDYAAPADRGVEAHVPLLRLAGRVETANGEQHELNEEALVLASAQTGGHIRLGGIQVTVPESGTLEWPARPHNPYAKDGRSSLSTAKLVLRLPFTKGRERYEVRFTHAPETAFQGIVFEARDLPFTHSPGTYTKRLDNLGSLFLGSTEPGSTLAFTLPEVPAGRYELLGEFVRAHSYGIVRVLLDGEELGEPYDAYAPGVDAEGERVSFGMVELGAGNHEVAVKVVDKNEDATHMVVSVKRWLLRPAE